MATDYLEYDPQVLKHLHQVQTRIMKDVDEFCKAHDVPYFVNYGSLIGVVRHQGFIPWDDDIDICMFRSDMDSFIELARADKTFSERYRIFTPKEERYPNVFPKVSLKGTRLLSHELVNEGIDYGINIDIFPLDSVPEDQGAFKRKARIAFLLSKLLYLYHLKNIHIPLIGIKGMIAALGCKMIHYLLHLLPLRNGIVLLELYEKNCTAKRTGDLLVDYCDTRAVFAKGEVFPTVSAGFEDITVQIPREYDRMLRSYYGDYMKLPPEDKRTNHAPIIIEFCNE